MSTTFETAAARWLVVSNCQTLGLANSLNLINSSINVDCCTFTTFKDRSSDYLDKISSYDLIVVSPQFVRSKYGSLTDPAKTKVLPTVYFDGYHPDTIYVSSNHAYVKSPLAEYHSALVFAAYKCQLDAKATRNLFCAKTYQALGYFDAWENAKKNFIDSFQQYGMDIAGHFQRWSANASFMHGINHPNIRCLHDLARALLRSQGLAEEFVQELPHDNLLNGPIFPIYDEIAERYSISGSYRFKMAGQYRQMSLDEFIRASFAVYDNYEPSTLATGPLFKQQYDKTVMVIRGSA